jgi:hypothetical protein
MLVGCGESSGAAKDGASGANIERSERNEVAASLQREEAAETARNRELLSEMEAKTREEAAEAAAKKTEATARAKAKKREKAAAKEAELKERTAEENAKKKQQALQAEAKRKLEGGEQQHTTTNSKTQAPGVVNATTAPSTTPTPAPGG